MSDYSTQISVDSTTATNADWRFILAKSADLSNIGELTQARSRQLQVGLNKPGECSFTVPMTLSQSYPISPIETCVKCIRNGVVIWSGPVWTMQYDTASGKDDLSVSCVGWYELLNRRVLSIQKTYANRSESFIAFDLLANANAVFPATPIAAGTDTTGTAHVRTVLYQMLTNIGQEISNLSRLESGFDMYVDPVTRQLNLYEKLSTIQKNAVFGYGWGPMNVESVTAQVDGSKVATQIIAQGKYANASATVDSTTLVRYGLLQDVDSVTSIPDPTVVAAYANAEIAVRGRPYALYSFVPMRAGKSSNVPLLFQDYKIGDVVYLTIKRGGLNVSNQPVRVFAATIAIDDNGNEQVTQLQSTADSG